MRFSCRAIAAGHLAARRIAQRRGALRVAAMALAASAVYAPTLLLAQPSDPPSAAAAGSAPAAMPAASAAAAGQPAAPGYSGPAWVSFRSPKFEIPFSVDAVGTQPVEVQLLVSRDGGARWEMFARQPAASRQFPFQAADDGDYWFATRTIDATGAAHPAGPVAPQLRVTVDRTNPQVDAQADADGTGQIAVDFRITDAAPDAAGIRLEYMTDTVRQWMPVQAAQPPVLRQQPGLLEGRVLWTPQSDWRHVEVCLIARDRAGNQTVLTRRVEKPRVATQVPAQLASTPLVPPAVAASHRPAEPGLAMPPIDDQPSAPSPDPRIAAAPIAGAMRGFATVPGADRGYHWPAAGSSAGLPEGRALPAAAPVAGPPYALANAYGAGDADATYPGGETALDLNPPAAAAVVPDVASASQPGAASAAAAMRPLPFEELPAPRPMPIAADIAPQADVAPADDAAAAIDQETLTAESTAAEPAYPAAIPSLDPAPAPARPTPASNDVPPAAPIDLAGIRQSNSHKFSLDYEVEAVGSGGLSAIELWATKDQGRTWEAWGSDPDGESPFDIETVGQGVYGFKMVVVGGNGLTSPRPMAGDPADLYVLVDTQQPTAKITGAQYGEQQETGQLIISYRCDDPNQNLVDRPVTLLFAATPDGPWTTIATGLGNDGRYAWPADPQLPRQIYLRVEAVDRAGNVGGYTLDTPVNVQGLAPRARIRGFNPVAENTDASAPTARFK